MSLQGLNMKTNKSVVISVTFVISFVALTISAQTAEISGTVTTNKGYLEGSDGNVRAYIGNPCNLNDAYDVGYAELSMVDGTYNITGLPAGTYYINARINPRTEMEWWSQTSSTNDCSKAQPIILDEDDNITGIDFELSYFEKASGTVFDSEGIPIVKAEVRLYKNPPCGSYGSSSSLTTTIWNGSFDTWGVPGEYYLTAKPEGNYLEEWWTGGISSINCNEAKSIKISPGTSLTDINFWITGHKSAEITGTTFDKTDNKFSPTIDVYAYIGDPCGVHSLIKKSTRSSNYERYTIGGLPAGNYFLKASGYYFSTSLDLHESYYANEWWNGTEGSSECSQAKAIEVVAGETVEEVNFELEHGGVIRGHVYFISGTEGLVKGAEVAVYAGNPCVAPKYALSGYTSKIDASYSILRIPAGTYYLNARGFGGFLPEWWTGSESSPKCKDAKPIVIEAGKVISNKDFQLDFFYNISPVNNLLLNIGK